MASRGDKYGQIEGIFQSSQGQDVELQEFQKYVQYWSDIYRVDIFMLSLSITVHSSPLLSIQAETQDRSLFA